MKSSWNAEVDQFDSGLFCEQDVGAFDIPMGDLVAATPSRYGYCLYNFLMSVFLRTDQMTDLLEGQVNELT